jgi:membrane-associated protease RseP (regulator of RpoE activity)
LGPFVIDDHPAVPLALGLLNSVLGLVVLRTSHLAIGGAVSERRWNEAVEASMAAQQRFAEGLAALLADAGLEGGDEIVKLYEDRPRL